MPISSRTPEGVPHRCPICGEVANVEPAWPGGDDVCPACGSWLLYFRDRVPNLDERLRELESGDSLDMVELMMELEEEVDALGFQISDFDAESIQTIDDLIRWLRKNRPEMDL